MRLFAATAISLSSLAISANAAFLIVNNYCTNSLYLSDSNQTNWTPAIRELKTGTSYLTDIVGEGNQLGVSVIKDYYNDNTPRFILGSSLKDDVVWWTVNNIGGDPFEGEPFNVTSTDNKCDFTTEYNLVTHNCPDGNFVLSFNPCVDHS